MCTWLKQGHGDRRARLTPRNLSSIIWAFGSFGYAPLRMPFLLDLAEQRLMQCNAQDLANIVCGLAACERPDLASPSLLASAELHACSMMSAFSPQARGSACLTLLASILPCDRDPACIVS